MREGAAGGRFRVDGPDGWPALERPKMSLGDSLIISLLGGLSGRFGGYGFGFGHGRMGALGVILIVVLVLLVTGRL